MADALLFALRYLWQILASLNQPVAVMGGLAVSAWKNVRATQDIDLLVAITPLGPEALLDRLQEAGFRAKHSPPVLSLGQLRILQLLYEPPEVPIAVQVDLLLAESEYHRAALERRVPLELPGSGFPVAVLACEDLILHKLLAGRILDRADVIALLRANQSALDRQYLESWAGRLDLTGDLAEAWTGAFPNAAPGEAAGPTE